MRKIERVHIMNRQIRRLAYEYLAAWKTMSSDALQNDPSANHTQMTFADALELARSTLDTVSQLSTDQTVEG